MATTDDLKKDSRFKGKIAELKFEMRAAQLGYIVSRPIIDANYDYILDDGTKLVKVQVKYAGYTPSRLLNTAIVNLRHYNHNDRSKTKVYLDSDVDAVVVYIQKTDQICWLPPALFHGKMNVNIRMDNPERSYSNAILSKDYIW